MEANDACKTNTFEDNESIADMIQRNVMKGTDTVRDSQVDNQATIVKYYSFSDKGQKGQVETRQQTVKKLHNEPGLKIEIDTGRTSKDIRSNQQKSSGCKRNTWETYEKQCRKLQLLR